MPELNYNITVDLSDRNSSQALAANLVGPDQRVLDVGCATGYTGVVMKALNCTVVGIEIETAAVEIARERLDEVHELDIETIDAVEQFGAESFDAVVFADVLEHMREPGEILASFRPLLRPTGAVVASIPNVAHGALRLALFDGRFDYTDRGLLDATHLRFFTLASIHQLFESQGFTITDVERTRLPLDATEIPVDLEAYPPGVVDAIRASPEWDTYQFVVRAVPNTDPVVIDVAEKASVLKRGFRKLPVPLREKVNRALRRG